MNGRLMFGSVGMVLSSRMWHICGVFLDMVSPLGSIVNNLVELLWAALL